MHVSQWHTNESSWSVLRYPYVHIGTYICTYVLVFTEGQRRREPLSPFFLVARPRGAPARDGAWLQGSSSIGLCFFRVRPSPWYIGTTVYSVDRTNVQVCMYVRSSAEGIVENCKLESSLLELGWSLPSRPSRLTNMYVRK